MHKVFVFYQEHKSTDQEIHSKDVVQHFLHKKNIHFESFSNILLKFTPSLISFES